MARKASTPVGNGRKGQRGSWADDPGRAEVSAEVLDKFEQGIESSKAVKIEMPELEVAELEVTVVSDSSLICNRFSEKALRQILDKQEGKASAGRKKKIVEDDYLASIHRMPDGRSAFPAIAFKSAMVTACTSLGRSVITKVQARQAFHAVGELVPIEGEHQLRLDYVRIPGTTDVRARAEFPTWRSTLVFRYNTRVLTPSQIVNLLNTAGFAVGVGEWRPEKDGMHGMFHVEGVQQ